MNSTADHSINELPYTTCKPCENCTEQMICMEYGNGNGIGRTHLGFLSVRKCSESEEYFAIVSILSQ